jgi:fibronectin-binding autotransporter adhesin
MNTYRSSARRHILLGSIASALLAHTSDAVDVFIPPNFTINSDAGAPIFSEGLIEGKTTISDDETTVNPANSSPELGLRMATINQNPMNGQIVDGWGNPATWIYTGQIFSGPNGVISFAANNDDADWLKIAGTVRLNDNAWDTTVATVVSGLTPNTWVDFEYRVSDTGGGGAGPSGQNRDGASNWTNTRGAVISHDDEANSLNALDYTYGLAGVGSYEIANGTPELFRYQSGFGFDDNLKVTGSGTITIDGTNSGVIEPSLAFQTTGATLTVNDGTGAHKTLSFTNGTTLGNANGQSNIINGSADVKLGRLLDGGFTGLTLTHTGPGKLILDATSGNDADGATIAAGIGGNIHLQGAGFNPAATLGGLAISGSGGTITVGGTAGATYDTAFVVAESGNLIHTAGNADTLGGTNGISVAATKTLTVNNTGGLLTLAGGVSGGGTIEKAGSSAVNFSGAVTIANLRNTAGTMRLNGTSNVTAVESTGGTLRVNGTSTFNATTVSGGRVEINGQTTLTNAPTITGAGTLALRNGAGTNVVPNPLVLPSGNLEIIPGALGAPTVQTVLTGGTLTLDAPNGLLGRYYAGDDGGARAAFGGPAFATNTYTQYTGYFATRDGGGGAGPASISALTSAGEVTQLVFNTSEAQFSAYGFNNTNNIISRQFGKILINQPGLYTFATTSDDGSMLYINGTTVVANNEYQGPTRRTGTFTFASPGLYDIDIGFYEGTGGNSLTVDYSGPDTGGATQFIPNTVLFQDANPATFANPIEVQASSTIHVAYHTAVANSLTLQPGASLTKTGNNLVAAPIFPSAGAYGFNVTGQMTATNLQDGGLDVDITKTGPGILILENTATPQLQNPGSSITLTQGAVGVLLETGGLNPLGNANVVYNGGGLVLSSKGGDQSFTIPAFAGNAVVEARRVGSGVAGPVNINLTGNLNIPSGQSLTLGTADGYAINAAGTASGTGTLKINGGLVNVTSPAGLNGFKVVMNPLSAATLDVDSNTMSVQSLATEGTGTSVITPGTTGSAVITINGSDSARFAGSLNEVGGSTLAVVRSGTGVQTFLGNNNFTGGVTINGGTLEFVGTPSIDGNEINLNGGVLRLTEGGLRLRIYDSDPNATGAYNGILNTIQGVNSHYAGLGNPATSVLTTANGNTVISYNPDGDNDAPFAIHGNTDAETIQALMTGKFFAATAGDYTFDPMTAPWCTSTACWFRTTTSPKE